MDAMCRMLLLEFGANFMIWLLGGAILSLLAIIYGRRRIEAAVRNSEAQFRTLVESSPEGIAIVDRHGAITYVSPAYERMVGYRADELIGHTYMELLHPDDLSLAAEYFAVLMNNPEQLARAEVRLRHKNGSWRIVESSGRLLPDGRMVGYSRDLTERRQVEEALRLAELRFRSVFEQPLLAVRIYSPDGRLLQWNETARQLFGVDAREIAEIARRYNIFDDEKISALGFDEQIRRVFSGEALAFPPVRFGVDRDRAAWSQIFMYPVTDRSGIVHEVVSMSINITAQKEAEEALLRLNEELEDRVARRTADLEYALAESKRLSTIIESTSDYVGIADLQGGSLYINRAGREMVGMSDADYEQSRNVIDCYPAHALPIALEMVAAVLNGETWSGEITLLHKDGREIPVSEVSFALRDSAGQIEYLATIIRDIGDQKRIQAELQVARDAAEAASRAKSTFLANMSHEIRTPMNAVIGMTGLLLNTALDARQRDFVETIRTAGDTLLTVINDILDFSKIEAGKLDLEQQPFDLRACVESAIDLLAARAEEKGIELAYSIGAHVPAGIVGDVARLRQILVNLLSNAIKFTERGEVVLTVEKPETAERLHFLVRDTGIGIRPEQIGRLFQSFSQLDPSTTRMFGGTGLGLAISKRLAELMGGEMWVVSAGPGCGATFGFSIDAPPAPLPVRAYQLRRPELAGRRILIVDDTATNRKILSLQLQTWGMQPIEAATPGVALAMLETGARFDLAILDMDLPEMNGVMLAERIAALQIGMPMMMLTSLGQSGSEPCMQLFTACLSKPVKSSQLYDALAEMFAIEADSPPEQFEQPIPVQVRVSYAPLRILVAEDVVVNQKFALLALEDLGYRADIAANGLEALAAVTRQPYDVILMDVQMPELDGLEATRRIRRLWASHDNLPTSVRPYIVAMTANALQGDRELCLEAGMDDYISKPVYLEELRAALERAAAMRVTHVAPMVDLEILAQVRARPHGAELLDLYIEEAQGLVNRIRAAVQQRNAADLSIAAHSLKGSSRYVGAAAVAELCVTLEQHGRSAVLNDSAALLAQLEAAYAGTITAIRASTDNAVLRSAIGGIAVQ